MSFSRITQSEETMFSIIDHISLNTSLGDLQYTTYNIDTFCKTDIKLANTPNKLTDTLVG